MTKFSHLSEEKRDIIEYLNAKYIAPDDVDMSVKSIRGDK